MLKLQAKGVAIWADEHHWTVHCVRSSEWSTFHLHLCISYQCIWGWQHLQKPCPKCHFTYIFAIFISLWGSTHDSADCWSAHRSLTASNVCTNDARLGGVGRVAPKQKSWLRRWREHMLGTAYLVYHTCYTLCMLYVSRGSRVYAT